jgi:hypothetical protein
MTMVAAAPSNRSIAREHEAAMSAYHRARAQEDAAIQRLPQWMRECSLLSLPIGSPKRQAIAKAERETGVLAAGRQVDRSAARLDAIHARLSEMIANSPEELLAQATALQHTINLEMNEIAVELCAALIAGLTQLVKRARPLQVKIGIAAE